MIFYCGLNLSLLNAYRYMNGDTPMQLEVPKDQYERVLRDFEQKTESGKVPGVTDLKEAANIVRKADLHINRLSI